jgi:hypothetical protein
VQCINAELQCTLNQYDCDHEVSPPVIQQIIVPRPLVYNLDSAARIRQVLAYVGLVDDSLQEAVLRLIAAENSIGAVDESLQEAVLRLTTTEASITALESVDDLQNAQLAVLNDGELVSGRAYSTGGNGGAIIAIKQNGEPTVDAEGNPATVPASLEMATYGAAETVEASLLLQGNLVTIAANLRVTGDLLLGDSENTVQAQLDDLEERILQEVIALASNYALDAAQQALIAGLALLLKPKGYEALPDLPDDEDFPDSNSIPPIRLFPAGKFTDELPDELGNIVERINSKGKITVSADVLPTRTMTVGGDVLFLQEDPDDEFECQYTCRLGSKVAVLDAELQLTNPDAVVVRFGTNALVTAAGAVNAAELTVDALTTGKVNGVSTNRLVQRNAPTVDVQLNRRVAKVSVSALAARRAAGKPVLTRSSDADVLRLHDEVLSVKRAHTRPVLAKSSDADVLRLHDEVLSVKRAHTRPVLARSSDADVLRLHDEVLSVKRALPRSSLAKDWSSDIAALKQRPINSSSVKQVITLPVRDSARAIGTVRDATTAIKAYTAPLSTSTTAAAKVVGTLSVSGPTTLAAGLTVSAGTTSLAGALNVTGKLLKLASDTDGGASLNGAGIQVGFDIIQPNNLLYNNGAWQSSIKMNMPSLGVTSSSNLAAVTATTLSVTSLGVTSSSNLAAVTATTLSATGASTLASVSATALSVTGASTLASVTATTLSTTGNSAINGVLRMGIAGTSAIAGYQGGTIYFNGPAGDSSDAYSGWYSV